MRLLAAVAIVAALLLGATYSVVKGQADAVFAASREELATIGRLRVLQVTAWRDERAADARATAGSPVFADAVEAWLRGPRDGALAGRVEDALRQVADAHHYENLLLVDLAGQLLASARPEHALVGPETLTLIATAAATGNAPVFDELIVDAAQPHVHIDAAATVVGHDGAPIAVLVLRSDPEATLYPGLLDWPSVSPSGESLLVARIGDRVVYLSTPRLAAGVHPASVDPAQADIAAAQAVNGLVGTFEGIDYRGVSVMADMRPVPGTEWFLVTKVDAAEIAAQAGIRGGIVLLLAVLAVLLAAVGAGFLLLARERAILHRLYDAERDRAAAAMHFDRLFALARDAFLLVDPAGQIVEVNEAAVAMYGYSRDAMLGMMARDLRAPESQAMRERDLAASLRPEGVLYEALQQRRDGTTFPVEVSSRAIEIGGRVYRQSIVRDITERRAAARALEDQVAELRRWNAAAVGREARVLGLKQEVNELLARLGLAPRYEASQPGADEPGDG
ncbi:MAG: PAS domain S-box protein [Chloroflexota bacterium]